MKLHRHTFTVLALALGLTSANAQQIVLKTGQRVDTLGVRRSGDKILGKIEVAGSSGEVGYPIANIAKIEFPEPKGIKIANDFLSQGEPTKALAEIEPVVAFYEPLKEIGGAWWGQAAIVKVSALAALQRDKEAEPLALEIQKNASDPEAARAANLRIANALIKKEDFEKAAQICDATIKESLRPAVLADAWVTRGNLFFAKKDWSDALIAYLHVPVFYPSEKLFLPTAMLGSARSYRRLEEFDRAKRSIKDLQAEFPKSSEAKLAQSELQKMK